MAQNQGPVAGRRSAKSDQGFSGNVDITNLQRDVLQAFLEHMGGLKPGGAGIYFKLKA